MDGAHGTRQDGSTGPAARSVRRLLLAACGWSALGLGLAGIFLPLLPTTPFVLLAGACFARSSPALHRRLLADRRLGPYLRQWRRDRSVPRGAKRRAYVLVVLAFSLSIALAGSGWQRWTLAGLGVALLASLTRLRTAGIEEVGEQGPRLLGGGERVGEPDQGA